VLREFGFAAGEIEDLLRNAVVHDCAHPVAA
jgi:hypothetical protein